MNCKHLAPKTEQHLRCSYGIVCVRESTKCINALLVRYRECEKETDRLSSVEYEFNTVHVSKPPQLAPSIRILLRVAAVCSFRLLLLLLLLLMREH